MILMKYGLRPLITFMVMILSATLVSAQADATGPDDLKTLFEDNLQRGVLNLSGKRIGDKVMPRKKIRDRNKKSSNRKRC